MFSEYFDEPTPLEKDIAFHRANIFDRHLLRFNVLMNTRKVYQDERDTNMILHTDLRIEDLVCDMGIMWPEA